MRVRMLLILTTVATPSVAAAHSRLVTPPSRSEEDFLMEGPCGGVPAGTPTSYEAGSTLTMEWATSQNHFNVFRVAFSPGDDLGFEENVLGTRPDEVEVFEYVQDVPLPACTCEACTLQLAQFTATGKLAYYSCADIRLTAPDGAKLDACPAAEEPDPNGSGTGRSTTQAGGESTGDVNGSDTGAGMGMGMDGTGQGSAAPSTGASETDNPPEATESASGCRTTAPAPWGSLFLCGLALIRRRRTEHPRATP